MQDAWLIKQFQNGDENAFRKIVDQHYKMIYHLSFRFIGNIQDAEEVTQDVFIRLHRHARNYTPDAKLSTYLYRIAVNLSLNRIRDNKRKRWTSLEILKKNQHFDIPSPATANPDTQMEKKEIAFFIRQAIESLPPNQKTAMVLKRYQNLSYEEIADIMHCSVSAVESRLHRAKLSLQKKLSHLME